jgi:hypothetical protein
MKTNFYTQEFPDQGFADDLILCDFIQLVTLVHLLNIKSLALPLCAPGFPV